VSQGISWPSLNQTVCALRFFYGVTLNRGEIPERIAYARTPRKLPAILSPDEVVRFLEAVPSLKSRAALTTAYAAGLRVSEAVSVMVGDIDCDRMLLQVRHGKGAKDRTVMLSAQLLDILRTYWRLTPPPIDVLPESWTDLSWKNPVMIGGSGDGVSDEENEVFGGADRLRAEAG
jgi:integrase/recombinase XerD